jgi:hypothetical protein
LVLNEARMRSASFRAAVPRRSVLTKTCRKLTRAGAFLS